MEFIENMYAAYPSVVPSGMRSKITVTATERCHIPFEGEKYNLQIAPVDVDVLDFHNLVHRTCIDAVASHGVIEFEYNFDTESEYRLELFYGERRLGTMMLYALDSDLYSLRPLKGDFHAHSYRSDGIHDPCSLAGYYREYGYDFMTLTDHNRYTSSEEMIDGYKDVKLGMTLIRGEEMHTPGSMVHIVHAGGSGSVDDIYFREPQRYEKEYTAIEKQLTENIPDVYRGRYAMAKWACENVNRLGGLAIFAHPYWLPVSKAYNVCNEFSKLLLTSGIFDAYELIGGMGCSGCNKSVALYNELRMQGLDIPIVGSSDVHKLNSHDFAYHFTIVFAKSNDEHDIVSAVKNGMSVAVEMSKSAENTEYRCYGSLRLVSYAQYLLENYFPMTQRLVQGEGELMRRYTVGEQDGAALSAMSERADLYYKRVFGILPPVIPSEDNLKYEEKWRAVQLKSPETCGGGLLFHGTNLRQI